MTAPHHTSAISHGRTVKGALWPYARFDVLTPAAPLLCAGDARGLAFPIRIPDRIPVLASLLQRPAGRALPAGLPASALPAARLSTWATRCPDRLLITFQGTPKTTPVGLLRASAPRTRRRRGAQGDGGGSGMDAEHAARRQRQAVAVESLLDDSWRGPLGGGGSGAGGPSAKPPHEQRKPHACAGNGPSSGTAPGAGGGADVSPFDDSLPLPTESGGEGLKGASTVQADNYALTVTSGTSGYLAEILLRCSWDVPPQLLFALFTHPNNSALFRGERRMRAEHGEWEPRRQFMRLRGRHTLH
eukprot:365976-Chlamydomonas_euryale.AAC.6